MINNNPFPRTANGRTVTDEECYCGALRTEHGPGPAGAFGHGACARTDCVQFTWKKMIVAQPKPAPRRKHSRSSQIKCELCAPCRCSKA